MSENKPLTYLKWSLAIVTATVIAFASLIFAFTLWIAFALANVTRLFDLYSGRAKGQGNGFSVIEGEYEILEESQHVPRSRSQELTADQQDKGAS